MEHVSTDAITGAITVIQFTPDEVAAYIVQSSKFLRKIRDQKLNDSDGKMVSDRPNIDRVAWAAYRQALRDLPAATADILNIEWPIEPSN